MTYLRNSLFFSLKNVRTHHFLSVGSSGLKVLLFLMFSIAFLDTVKAQDYFELKREYYPGFPFENGVYLNLEEFLANAPAYQQGIAKRGSQLYIRDDSTKEMIVVDPNKVWGYAQGVNVYLSYEEAFWRFINVGRLCHFTAIIITDFQTIDAFGFPTTQYSKTLQHLFLDTDSDLVYALNEEELIPFLEKDPILLKRFQQKKRKKLVDFVKALQAYNELYPIKFPVHE